MFLALFDCSIQLYCLMLSILIGQGDARDNKAIAKIGGMRSPCKNISSRFNFAPAILKYFAS